MKIKTAPTLSSQEEGPSLPSIPSHAQQSKLASILKNTLFIFCGFILALIFAEVVYRALNHFVSKPISWSDRPIKFYLSNLHDDIPHLTKILPKNPNTFRILVLGDSFTFGQGMQRSDAFPARIEKQLALAKSERKVEVVNWGVRGYSTAQELQLLRSGFEAVSPDLVILQITLNDAELKPYRVTHPYLDEHGRVKFDNPILKHWKSLEFALMRIVNSQTHSDYVKYYHDLFTNPETLNSFTGALEGFKHFTDSKNVPAFAVVFPLFSHTIDADYPFKMEHELIDKELNTLEIPMLDLKGNFKNIPPERLQISPGIDSHPNEIAHRIAADAIYSALKKYKLIPQEFAKIPNVRSR